MGSDKHSQGQHLMEKIYFEPRIVLEQISITNNSFEPAKTKVFFIEWAIIGKSGHNNQF